MVSIDIWYTIYFDATLTFNVHSLSDGCVAYVCCIITCSAFHSHIRLRVLSAWMYALFVKIELFVYSAVWTTFCWVCVGILHIDKLAKSLLTIVFD